MLVQLCVISAHMICSSYLTKYFTQTFAWKHINLKLTLSRIKISKNFYNISLIKQLAPFPTFLSFSFFLCCKFSHLFSTLYLKLTLIIGYANFRFQNYLWYFLIIFWWEVHLNWNQFYFIWDKSSWFKFLSSGITDMCGHAQLKNKTQIKILLNIQMPHNLQASNFWTFWIAVLGITFQV